MYKPVHTGDKGHGAFCEVREIVSKWAVFIKAVNISSKTPKEVGTLGERLAAEYLRRHGFSIRDHNIARKTGELDLVAEDGNTLQFVEVNKIAIEEFPEESGARDNYDPLVNLHEARVRKVAWAREWYVLEKKWRRGVAGGRVPYVAAPCR